MELSASPYVAGVGLTLFALGCFGSILSFKFSLESGVQRAWLERLSRVYVLKEKATENWAR
jgi:hypothetical protein